MDDRTDTGPGLAASVPLLERADLQKELSRLEDRLVGEYESSVPADVVRAIVREAETGLGAVRLHHFVPVLVERQARTKLGGRHAQRQLVS